MRYAEVLTRHIACIGDDRWDTGRLNPDLLAVPLSETVRSPFRVSLFPAA